MPQQPSTRNLAALPAPAKLEKMWRSFALLDAIMEPEWDMRIFSFDRSKRGSLGTLRDGEGNFVYGLFLPNDSAVLRGYHHDSSMNPYLHKKARRWPGLVDGMPKSLFRHRNAANVEPDEVTFVIWHDGKTKSGWQRGQQTFPKGSDPDGSKELLAPFGGDAKEYVAFAKFYFGRSVPRDAVRAIMDGSPIDATLIQKLNSERDTEEALREARAVGFKTKASTAKSRVTAS